MGIRILSISLLFTQCFCGFSQGIETQRKYGFERDAGFADFIESSGDLDGFSLVHHSDLRYFDLYFDTPNFDLAENGYSLRMRKKEVGEGEFAYVFQLKSEMETTNGVRMEVEETELDFYYLFHNKIKIDLASFLDSLFAEMEHVKENATAESYQPYLNELVQWIEFKAGAPLVPFQKLRFLLPTIFSIEGIKKLRPVVIGQSVRSRSHVYLTPENSLKKTEEILVNKTIESENPVFFQDHPEFCWLFESSLDVSAFYPLFPSSLKSVKLWEYEVENKFPVDSIGHLMLDEFEMGLITTYELNVQRASKYLQSMLIFQD